jgi:hypothetical protein
VLGASVIEALLHWKISKLRTDALQQSIAAAVASATGRGINYKSPKGSIDRWQFQDLIEVAHGAAVIEESTMQGANLARDYRNLIHAAVVERTGMKCTQATALSTLGALDAVIQDLGRRK